MTTKNPTSMTKDPICGMPVQEMTAVRAQRDGQTFYFCSEACRLKFLATPTGAIPEKKPGGCCG